jgi:hypothetical protein
VRLQPVVSCVKAMSNPISINLNSSINKTNI